MSRLRTYLKGKKVLYPASYDDVLVTDPDEVEFIYVDIVGQEGQVGCRCKNCKQNAYHFRGKKRFINHLTTLFGKVKNIDVTDEFEPCRITFEPSATSTLEYHYATDISQFKVPTDTTTVVFKRWLPTERTTSLLVNKREVVIIVFYTDLDREGYIFIEKDTSTQSKLRILKKVDMYDFALPTTELINL